MVEHGAGDRPIADRRFRKHRVHGQHVLHESEIGPVIGDVPEGDESREQRNGCDHRGFGEANGDHVEQKEGVPQLAEAHGTVSTPAIDNLVERKFK